MAPAMVFNDQVGDEQTLFNAIAYIRRKSNGEPDSESPPADFFSDYFPAIIHITRTLK